MGYRILHRDWPSMKAMWMVMVAELAGTVACLVLFALAAPDAYRSTLREAGSQLGFNSSPDIQLYAYANYQPVPAKPFVWKEELTDFDMYISIVSLFALLAKLVAAIMRVWYPILALFFNLGLTVVYIVAVWGQASSDYSDPDHPMPVAWYIEKPCTVVPNPTIQSDCRMAKGTWAVTIIMLVTYLVNLGLNIWALIPNERDKPGYVDPDSDGDEESAPGGKGNAWEMQAVPPTPKTNAFTPRTTAFNTLERRMPLRRDS